MNYLKPYTVTDAMLSSTTVAEPASGEVAWVSGAAYTAGDEVIRTTTHRRYIASQTHTGRTTAPELDAPYWNDVGPTKRWTPFDQYTSTAATDVTSISYVLTPGYFNALALYGLTGADLHIVLKDAPGGAVLYEHEGPLTEDPAGWYEYLFVAPKVLTQFNVSGLPIRPSAELTVTVTAATGQPVGIGMLVLGDLVSLVGDLADFGGTEYGATAEPVSYSYIKTDDFGETTIVRRSAATSMTAKIVLPAKNADDALRLIQDVLDVPVAWIALPGNPKYKGLNVFGLGSARVAYENYSIARIDLTVKGMI